MKELILKILSAAAKGETAVRMDCKNSKVEIKKGKLVHTIKELTIELDLPEPK